MINNEPIMIKEEGYYAYITTLQKIRITKNYYASLPIPVIKQKFKIYNKLYPHR
jgi:hypothetical protein